MSTLVMQLLIIVCFYILGIFCYIFAWLVRRENNRLELTRSSYLESMTLSKKSVKCDFMGNLFLLVGVTMSAYINYDPLQPYISLLYWIPPMLLLGCVYVTLNGLETIDDFLHSYTEKQEINNK